LENVKDVRHLGIAQIDYVWILTIYPHNDVDDHEGEPGEEHGNGKANRHDKDLESRVGGQRLQ
jgi:hypothetical protein